MGKFEPGELRLEGGLVAFTSKDRGLVFRAPVQEIRASFPKLCLGAGAKLAVGGKTYRLCSYRCSPWPEERASDLGEGRGQTVVAGNKMLLEDFGPALATIEEAVAIRRTLAAARPDAFLPDLAMALNNLSADLADLGRPEEALAAKQEADAIQRRLDEA